MSLIRVMLKAVSCLRKKQSGNTGSLQVTVEKECERMLLHLTFPMKDHLSVKQFLK